MPQHSFPQSPTFFPIQTPQNKNVSFSSKFKENNSYQKNKEHMQPDNEKQIRRAMRRREISEPNLTTRVNQSKLESERTEAKLHRNGFSSNIQLEKKKSDDNTTSNNKKGKHRGKKQEDINLLME
jgi:hypothetical protein